MANSEDRHDFEQQLQDEQERRAVEALHALRADRAPDHLRLSIERIRAEQRRPRRRAAGAGAWSPRAWRPAILAPAAGALALVVLAVVLALPGGAPGAPSLVQAAELAVHGPSAAAPRPSSMAPQALLSQRVQNLDFPNWARFGWNPTGQRADRIDGRLAVTVYYRWEGHSIAYTIVDTPVLKQLAVAPQTVGGTTFQTVTMNGRLVVTWQRDGHTCILSGVGAVPQTLYQLAAWRPTSSSVASTHPSAGAEYQQQIY